MKHITCTPFRGPALRAHVAAARSESSAPPVAKWEVLTHLRAARAHLGLSDRSLTVLQALLSFLPARELRPGEPLVVFPSNATLSERVNGMPESTLRRHLAALVGAGLLLRRDSPNGKRYATRGLCPQAFGFDLVPLQARAAEFARLAREAADASQALRDTRARAVLLLRDAAKIAALARDEGHSLPAELSAALEDARRQLRRRPEPDALARLVGHLEALVATVQALVAPACMGGNDAQNERHQQSSIPETHEQEPCRESSEAPDADPGLPLPLVLKACPEILTYAPQEPRGWRDLIAVAERVRAWLGIAAGPWHEAKARLGPAGAAVTLAAILQRAHAIRNPGAYLRSLLRAHGEGRFTLPRMIHALLAG